MVQRLTTFENLNFRIIADDNQQSPSHHNYIYREIMMLRVEREELSLQTAAGGGVHCGKSGGHADSLLFMVFPYQHY